MSTPLKKENFFISRIKKYQIITFTFGLLFLNAELVFWADYLAGKYLFLKTFSQSILVGVIGFSLFCFLIWLLVVWVASKLPREKLQKKCLMHPIATIVLFILYITSLPSKLSGYWGINIVNIFDTIIGYTFVSFLWWLLICWISDKIFKRQECQWTWYRKAIEKIFVYSPLTYKIILGLIAAWFIFIVLFWLITTIFHYSGLDIQNLFNY